MCIRDRFYTFCEAPKGGVQFPIFGFLRSIQGYKYLYLNWNFPMIMSRLISKNNLLKKIFKTFTVAPNGKFVHVYKWRYASSTWKMGTKICRSFVVKWQKPMRGRNYKSKTAVVVQRNIFFMRIMGATATARMKVIVKKRKKQREQSENRNLFCKTTKI